jgi:site-specific DNA recombinase
VTSTDVPWNIYLRLSDFRDDSDGFDGRERRLRDAVARRGGTVAEPPIIENDLANGNGNGRSRPASAFKRRKVVTPSGRTEWRVYRPGFRRVLDDLTAGRANVMCEDLDRAARDPRDLEDLVDAVAASGLSAGSVSGSLTLTEGGTDAEVTMARIMVTIANKSSRDNARRVSAKRADLAGQSYGGGRRPYGYRPDPHTEKYHRKLVKVPAEAKVIDDAATDLLEREGISLKAIARDLRERGVPTVTGTAWSAKTLRDVLIKPAVAGLAVKRGGGGAVMWIRAPWDPILERDRWERLRDLLTDPARRTNASRANEPRWLVSGFATCGVCGGPLRVSGGRNRAAAYIGKECCHVRRNAEAVDRYVAEHVIARMDRPDAATLLKPPPRSGIDASKIRAEARALGSKRKAQIRMHREGILTDAELAGSLRAFGARLDAIDAKLAVSDEVDPLTEFREGRPADAVWAELGMPRRRAVVQTVIESVVIKPAGRRGAGFDPAMVKVTPAPGV